MRTTAKADYAIRASAELAAAGEAGRRPSGSRRPRESRSSSSRTSCSTSSTRGSSEASAARRAARLARPPEEIALADVIRAVEGPLANVRGLSPDALEYEGAAEKLRDVWVALRASQRAVLEQVSLGDLARGELPAHVEDLIRDPDAWTRR